MDIELLVKVAARGWCLPILAAMHDGVSGRQAALSHAVGAGRSVLRQSLEHLIDLGLLERNPGHGHPLRPEFRLTNAGRAMAKRASRVMTQGGDASSAAVLRRAWSLPLLCVLQRPLRFGEIKAALPSISDRALSNALRLVEAHGWVRREAMLDARPPYARYRAVGAGASIGAAWTE